MASRGEERAWPLTRAIRGGGRRGKRRSGGGEEEEEEGEKSYIEISHTNMEVVLGTFNR